MSTIIYVCRCLSHAGYHASIYVTKNRAQAKAYAKKNVSEAMHVQVDAYNVDGEAEVGYDADESYTQVGSRLAVAHDGTQPPDATK